MGVAIVKRKTTPFAQAQGRATRLSISSKSPGDLRMSHEARFHAAPKLKEFRDTRLWFQYAMGGIAAVGLVGAITLFRQAGSAPHCLVAAGAVVVSDAIRAGSGLPEVRQSPWCCGKRIAASSGFAAKIVRPSRYSELFGLRAKWTDVLRNGVYNHTLVRLAFSSEDPAVPVLNYDSTVDYDTLKYNELHEFQCEVAEIVAQRMADAMHSEGSVKWTEKLSLRPDGLELTKKPSAAPELIGFDRISQWKLDEGLFKLGVDGSRRPVLVEATDQWNFYPGLLLFSQLCPSPSDDASIDEDEPVLIG